MALSLGAVGAEERFEPAAAPPLGASLRSLDEREEIALKPLLLAAAFSLLALDAIAALFVAGRLRSSRAAAAVMLLGALALGAPLSPARAAEAPNEAPVDPAAQFAALETILAYVVTGDPEVDRVSSAGMRTISNLLFQRTTIEPLEPAAVDLEKSDISVYSMLYWPITPTQAEPSDAALRRLNQYLRTGGLLILDTRDAHLAAADGEGPNAAHLRRLVGRLDLPPLEPMDDQHLMTRTFYITQGAPGRWEGGRVWVQAGTGGDDFSRREGGSRPTLNDGVSSVLIGGADWAAAWALDDRGRPLKPMGGARPQAREQAHRFGMNLAMYAYTGSYKSDQVHIEELLLRIGE